MEKGKAFYETGQYMAALGEFMTILRRDPQNPEARQYLRLVVDAMRQTAPKSSVPGRSPAQITDSRLKETLQKRTMLTLDLRSIPGVEVSFKEGSAQAKVESSLLFQNQSGSLKEGGIPVLDRVNSWLRTFGDYPILLHLYPEERPDYADGGALFLRRYAELYSYFVDEKKVNPRRFVSADIVQNAASDTLVDTSTPTVVFEVLSDKNEWMEGIPLPRLAAQRWIEFSIYGPSSSFSPEEGEWLALDLSAISPRPIKSWQFVIAPTPAAKGGKLPQSVFKQEGSGNLLRRITWDGRDSLSGRLVPAGSYTGRLTAVLANGQKDAREVALSVIRTGRFAVEEPKPAKPVTAAAPRKKSSPKKKKAEPKPAPAPEPREPVEEPVEPEAAAAEESDPQSIWKQKIEFETGSAAIAPTLKSTLERIAKTLEVYPLQKVRVIGHASTGEPQPDALARKRAAAVRSALLQEYGVSAERVMDGGVRTRPGASFVELSITN